MHLCNSKPSLASSVLAAIRILGPAVPDPPAGSHVAEETRRHSVSDGSSIKKEVKSWWATARISTHKDCGVILMGFLRTTGPTLVHFSAMNEARSQGSPTTSSKSSLPGNFRGRVNISAKAHIPPVGASTHSRVYVCAHRS